MMPIFECHLLEYGVEERYIGLWYSISTSSYFIGSLLLSMPYTIKKSKLITGGCFLLSLAYFLFGPAPFLFDENLTVVAISLTILGAAITLMNSK